MNRALSLYLDILRFSAAMVVFIGHVSGVRFTDGLFWQISAFQSEAVCVFFVLSGFVISYVTATRETMPADYAVARAARIASVAVPALVLTFSLDQLGRQIRPELYSHAWGYVADGQWRQFLAGLTFTNQLWFRDVPIGSDLPYWSLGFEVWYYVLFGVLAFGRGPWRWLGALVVLALIGPKIALMFPIWLMGLATYRICVVTRLPVGIGAALFILDLALWVAYENARLAGQFPIAFGTFGGIDLVGNYAIALLFCLHLIGAASISRVVGQLPSSVGRSIRWFAGMTFSLYLVHLPVAQFLATLVPWPSGSWATRFVEFGGTLAVVAAFAQVTERRKNPWQRFFVGLLQRYKPQPARVP